jgi:glycosyltransferase involved in cell wall biosynthesis
MLKNKKIAVIGTVGIPAKYGGFETLVENLVDNLGQEFCFTVYCSKNSYEIHPKEYKNAKLVYLPFKANGISSIIYDVLSVFHSLFYADVLLVLGVSGAFVLPIVKLLTKKKIITNIDGLEWKRDKWGSLAKKYLKKQEEIAVKYSHDVVVDNEGIQEHVTSSYSKSSHLISYGGDHVFNVHLKKETIDEFNLPKTFAFKVCRIEPENNIHLILEAFSESEINLVIVGNWSNNEYGKNLKKFYNKKNMYLLDPIYAQEQLNEIRSNCFLYIHGHSAGGTNPSLVEAMCLGLPILAFDVSYNKFTTKNEALYFLNKEELIINLKLITKDPNLLMHNSIKMKEISFNNYKWRIICDKYKTLFI